jgi:hypothetical protein
VQELLPSSVQCSHTVYLVHLMKFPSCMWDACCSSHRLALKAGVQLRWSLNIHPVVPSCIALCWDFLYTLKAVCNAFPLCFSGCSSCCLEILYKLDGDCFVHTAVGLLVLTE